MTTALGEKIKAIIQANEASFEALVADLEREGRLAHTSDGHSHERAKRDRLAAAPELSPVPGEGEIRLVRGMPRGGLDPSHPIPSAADRERAYETKPRHDDADP